jgi:hypothetical protein
VSEKWFEGGERAQLHGRQWVRVPAQSSEQAKRLVTEVLGRRPQGLAAFQDMIRENPRQPDRRRQPDQARAATARRTP